MKCSVREGYYGTLVTNFVPENNYKSIFDRRIDTESSPMMPL